MTSYKKPQKNKTFREQEREHVHGKKGYRLRKQLEKEGSKEVKEWGNCTEICLKKKN